MKRRMPEKGPDLVTPAALKAEAIGSGRHVGTKTVIVDGKKEELLHGVSDKGVAIPFPRVGRGEKGVPKSVADAWRRQMGLKT